VFDLATPQAHIGEIAILELPEHADVAPQSVLGSQLARQPGAAVVDEHAEPICELAHRMAREHTDCLPAGASCVQVKLIGGRTCNGCLELEHRQSPVIQKIWVRKAT